MIARETIAIRKPNNGLSLRSTFDLAIAYLGLPRLSFRDSA